MTIHFIPFIISFLVTCWIIQIIKHWNDSQRMGTWYWRIWWFIFKPFYPIKWWWEKHFKNKKDAI